MKAIFFSVVFYFSFFVFMAGTCNSQNDIQGINNEVTQLKKNNAILKNQLNDQKEALKILIVKTDSIIAVLQSTGSEVKKSTDNQTSISKSIKGLKQAHKAVINAFVHRKKLAIIAFIIGLVGIAVFIFLLLRKLSSINKNIKRVEDELIESIQQVKKQIRSELAELNEVVNQLSSKNIALIEKVIKENNERITILSDEFNEKIKKTSNELNNISEMRFSSTEAIFSERILTAEKENQERTDGINIALEKNVAALRKEITENITQTKEEITVKIESSIKTSESALNKKLTDVSGEINTKFSDIIKNSDSKFADHVKNSDTKISAVKNEIKAVTDDLSKRVSNINEQIQKKK